MMQQHGPDNRGSQPANQAKAPAPQSSVERNISGLKLPAATRSGATAMDVVSSQDLPTPESCARFERVKGSCVGAVAALPVVAGLALSLKLMVTGCEPQVWGYPGGLLLVGASMGAMAWSCFRTAGRYISGELKVSA